MTPPVSHKREVNIVALRQPENANAASRPFHNPLVRVPIDYVVAKNGEKLATSASNSTRHL
jgi:hypothetical protein